MESVLYQILSSLGCMCATVHLCSRYTIGDVMPCQSPSEHRTRLRPAQLYITRDSIVNASYNGTLPLSRYHNY